MSQAAAILGDVIPPAVTRLYTGLDSGRVEEAASAFAEQAVYAVPPPGEYEAAPRTVVEGRDAIFRHFIQRPFPAVRHQALICLREANSCLIEGSWHDRESDRVRGTFAVSIQLDGDGRITRYLAFACEPVVEPGPVAGERGGDAAAVVHRYFSALADADFDAAAACFSERVVYSHPPYRAGGMSGSPRLVFSGRDELRRAFGTRGRTSYRHHMDVCLQSGPHCLFELHIPDLPEGRTGSGVSSLSLDADGLIDRYVAFYCEPAIARRS